MIPAKNKFIIISLVLVFSPILASAGGETQINEQLKNGGTVTLEAGTYIISSSIIIPSNTILQGTLGPNGEKLTIIQVRAHAGWASFVPLISVINAKNVVIKDLIIDGNRNNNLDVGANFPNGKAHGHGFYNDIHFIDCDNVEVYNVELRNGLGDGVRTKYCTNVKFHDNVCYNLGHDAFYGVDSQNIEAHNNRIETETDDGLRLWNSQHVRFYSNYITAGEKPDGLSGNAGFQVEFSKPIENADIEICNNIIYKSWGSAFWLIGYGQGAGKNHGINIHHNLIYLSPYTHSIDYAAGITVYGVNGLTIANNVFDGAKNSAVSSQIGGENTVIKDNIITNTRELEINQAGNGYGIADRSGAGLTISNNCFYKNQKGNLYSCSSSNDDLQDPKTHVTSSGWTWTGSTWTCAFVAPIPLGEVAATTTRNSTDTDTHEINSIFDILELEFTDSGRTEQKVEDIKYLVKETEQGRIAGGIKILGFKDLIKIDNISYIPDNESILYKAAAVKAPSFDWWSIGTSNISKTVNVKIENGTAKAVLIVKLEYYTIKTDFKTGKTTKKFKTSKAVFNDSCPAPNVLQRPTKAQGIITYYNNSMNPHTLVYVPSNGLTKVAYEYGGNTSEHTLMIGEKDTGENGVQYTNFSICDYWRGDIPFQGNALFIPGSVDKNKLNVTCYTPYESFQVKDFKYIEKTWTGQSFSDWVLPFVLKGGIIVFFLWRLLKIPFS